MRCEDPAATKRALLVLRLEQRARRVDEAERTDEGPNKVAAFSCAPLRASPLAPRTPRPDFEDLPGWYQELGWDFETGMTLP